MKHILLLGATGYMGEAFARELARRDGRLTTLSRAQVDYTHFDVLRRYLREEMARVNFLINAAGFTGRPNVDQCEVEKDATIRGNLLLPQMLSHLAAVEDFLWLQISTGCIYEGDNGGRGFTEEDEPNFTFAHGHCSFYSGVKALAEASLKDDPRCYLCRARMPFDEFDGPRNYLTKLLTYPKIYDHTNSLTHRGDFVLTCLDLFEQQCLPGIYNVTNEGAVTTREVVALIEEILKPDREFEYFANDEEFYQFAQTPRSNCVLDVGKLAAAGLPPRPVREALRDALEHWVPTSERTPPR